MPITDSRVNADLARTAAGLTAAMPSVRSAGLADSAAAAAGPLSGAIQAGAVLAGQLGPVADRVNPGKFRP